MDTLISLDPELENRYHWERWLGNPSRAATGLVTGIRDGQKYILKKLPGRCYQVYALLAKLQLSFVPHIYYVQLVQQQTVLVEEFLEGRSLQAVEELGPLTELQSCKILLQLCQDVALLHKQQVVHNGLLAGAVFLQKYGKVKLLHFEAAGFYKAAGQQGLDGSATPASCPRDAGTVLAATARDQVLTGSTPVATTACPKPLPAEEKLSPGLDIYALGTLLKDLVDDKASAALCKIICKATAFKPEYRYQSVQALERDVQNVLAKGGRTKKLGALAGACLLVLCLAGWGYFKLYPAPAAATLPKTAAPAPPVTTASQEKAKPSKGTGVTNQKLNYDLHHLEEAIHQALSIPEGHYAPEVIDWTISQPSLDTIEACKSKSLGFVSEKKVEGRVHPHNDGVFQIKTMDTKGQYLDTIYLDLPANCLYIRRRLINGLLKDGMCNLNLLEFLDKNKQVLNFWLLSDSKQGFAIISQASKWQEAGYVLPAVMQVVVNGPYVVFDGGPKGRKGTLMVMYFLHYGRDIDFQRLELEMQRDGSIIAQQCFS